ncbi:MAG: molecular chaperone [Thermoanaerobaculia bacterium]
MTTLAEAPRATDRALARAVLGRALKLGFDRPGDALLEAFFSRQGRQALRVAARNLDGEQNGRLEAALESVCASRSPGLDPLNEAYERLFGHTLRGRVCPYECEYGRQALLMRSNELADLGGFYAAFGLRSSDTRHERHDHIACEFEFLEFLSRKECWAIEQGDTEMAEVTLSAVGSFLTRHLARFGRAFARSLRDTETLPFYNTLGRLCEVFLLVECARLGVAVGPKVLTLRSTEPDKVPMACGSESDDLVQIGRGECPEPGEVA